jgi:hypothetical protein
MGTPRFKSFSAFGEKIVALINSCNARDRAGLMIENFVGDVWSYAEPCHSGNAGSSQIMKSPSGDAGKLVDLSLARTEVLK